MIKQAIAATALLAATTAGAQSVYDAENNLIYTASAEGTDLGIVVTVQPQHGCKPIFALGGEGNNDIEEMEYELRVDRKPKWTITAKVRNTEDYVFAESWAPAKMITDMRRGNVLRIKLPQKDGSKYYDSFNLSGFSRAFSKAKAACIPPSRYFDEEPARNTSNAEYFL